MVQAEAAALAEVTTRAEEAEVDAVLATPVCRPGREPSCVLAAARRVNPSVCDLLQLVEGQQVVLSVESAVAAGFNAAVFGNHAHVGVEHAGV